MAQAQTTLDDIVHFKRKEEDDYYFILGCNENSNEDQIATEYKARVLSCHPDKHPNDETAHIKFSKLSQAKEVLMDPEQRRDYDRWRASGIAIPFDRWKSMKHMKTSMHWAMRPEQPSITNKSAQHNPQPHIAQSVTANQTSSSAKGNMPPMEFVHRGQQKMSGWDSDRSNPLLEKFRNYEI